MTRHLRLSQDRPPRLRRSEATFWPLVTTAVTAGTNQPRYLDTLEMTHDDRQ